MSTDATITETCTCGSTLRVTAWAPHALAARREFAAEHATCRERAGTLLAWGDDDA